MAAHAPTGPQPGLVVDGFAGPGGWSEGIRRFLGFRDIGLEWDDAACRTRQAAGHTTIRVDVSAFVLAPLIGRVWGLLMSPPCTKFSMAGKGFGNRVIPLLAKGIQRTLRGEDCRTELRDGIYPIALAEQQAANDKRKADAKWSPERVEAAAREDAFLTVLVLEPARYLYALITGDTSAGIPLEWAAFEQVPSVLPLWEVYAIELRRFGWHVWTGVLNAADYGVPQTRRRAVLIASGVRKVGPPQATHCEHDEPEGLFGDSRPQWVTMAQALGLDAGGVVNTRGDRKTPGGNEFPADQPSWALTEKARSWTLHTNRDQRPDGTRQTIDPHTQPAPSVTGKSGGQWVLTTGNNTMKHSRAGSRRGEGGVVAYEREADRPAPTLDTNVGNKWRLHGIAEKRPITQAEAAVLQSFTPDYPWQGTKTKQFEQIGNVVPPLLAAHIAAAAANIPVRTTGQMATAA